MIVKIDNIRRLLRTEKVMVSVIFRGREITHTDIGVRILDRVIAETADIADIESRSYKGNTYSIVLVRGYASAGVLAKL